MNKLQSTNLIYSTTIEPVYRITAHMCTCVHVYKLFTFFVTATYSLVPQSVNTYIFGEPSCQTLVTDFR